jgi:hypothetical protein
MYVPYKINTLFISTKNILYTYYFNNIYILVTPACFNIFVSSSAYSSTISQQYYKSDTLENKSYMYSNITLLWPIL